jgi:glycosyltransferase involved in cell wall biosynthesis
MEVFLVALARQLRSRGWRTVHVVAGEPGEFFRSELAELGSPCVVAQFPLSLVEACSLGRRLRDYRPEIIHTTFLSKFDPGLWMLKKFAGAPYLILGDQSSGTASTAKGLKRVLVRARGVVAGLCVNKIVAVSDFVKNRDSETVYLPAHKIRTIYNGVELEAFQAAKRVPYAAVTIAFAGQLTPEKGVHILLRAVKELSAEVPIEFQLLIAGQGGQKDELCRYCEAHKLNQVQFLGQIDWVPRLYKCADIVVVPSQWDEACAFSLIEAMACGACIVASDAGGNPELIGTDCRAGLLFSRSNVTELKRILAQLISDPERRMAIGNVALERAKTMFSMTRMVNDYVRLYDEIVPRSSENLRGS